MRDRRAQRRARVARATRENTPTPTHHHCIPRRNIRVNPCYAASAGAPRGVGLPIRQTAAGEASCRLVPSGLGDMPILAWSGSPCEPPTVSRPPVGARRPLVRPPGEPGPLQTTKDKEGRQMAERPKICIDRILPREMMRFQRTTRGPAGSVRAVAPIGKTWMNGSTLRVRFMAGTPAEQAVAREQAGWWAAVANLKFDFNNAPDAEIRITFDPNDGAWSYVGTDCRDIPSNEATMNLGFLDGGTAAHEFGHAIGLAHEHQNPDGRNSVERAGGHSGAGQITQFLGRADRPAQRAAQSTVRTRSTGRSSTPIRSCSISFPRRVDLERHCHQGERRAVPSRQGVHRRREDVPERPAPRSSMRRSSQVNAQTRTQASIGKVGEEDLFRFTAAAGWTLRHRHARPDRRR